MLYKLKLNIARFLRHPKAPIGAILMLHRTDKPNKDGIWYNQHLKMSTETIEQMVHYARNKGCRFVSLDEMADAITHKKNVRRWIAITLDDGYRDNYELGYPCFKNLKVPFCIYVTTNVVEGRMYYWWEYLEQLVLMHDKLELMNGKRFVCTTKEEKEKAFLAIREDILKLPQESVYPIQELFPAEYEFSRSFGKDDLGLTWEQIEELKKDPFATVGNHTYSHKAFTGCLDNDIICDINMAQDEMQRKTGIMMKHFAFPFGEVTAVSQHDIELVKQQGFYTSATTKQDYIRYGTELLQLPRIFVTENNWIQIIDGIILNC